MYIHIYECIINLFHRASYKIHISPYFANIIYIYNYIYIYEDTMIFTKENPYLHG